MNRLPELLFNKSKDGKVGYTFSESDFASTPSAIDQKYLRDDIEGFPEISVVEVTRHYNNLASLNHSVDSGFYPLGSCTMKHNPKINDKIASFEELQAHPYSPIEAVQGNLEIMKTLEKWLEKITGMDAVTLNPAAGAHGELVGMMVIRKHLEAQGNPRKIVLIPDSAHGTNPASANFAGYDVKQIPSNKDGILETETLKEHLNEDIAALMITNPNTLGIFEKNIEEIAELLHANGSQLYMDGANMNAFMGVARPGDFGADVVHLNLHKTLSTPHGGGGPGSGPIGVKAHLAKYLPVPVIREENSNFEVDYFSKEGIGRIKNFYGNFLVNVRALAYLMSLGKENLPRVAEDAVLNANYIRKRLENHLTLPYKAASLHEVVFSDDGLPVATMDIAKALLDYGIHPFTVYFPLIVHGAMMIEPTETESKETIDHFVDTMIVILEKAKEDPDFVRGAPYSTPVKRLDEVTAARKPVLRWEKG